MIGYYTDINSNSTTFVSDISDVTNATFNAYPPKYIDTLNAVNSSIDALQAMGYDEDTYCTLITAVIHSVYVTYGFEDKDVKVGNSTSCFDQLNEDGNVINLVFVYFFVAAGVTLIMMAMLNLLTLSKTTFTKAGWKCTGTWGRIGIFFIIGNGLVAVAGIVDTDLGKNLGSGSPWLLPIVTLGLVVVLGVQYVRWPQKWQLGKKRS